MATTLEVERQLSNAGYMPQGVDFSPRPALTASDLSSKLMQRGWSQSAAYGLTANAVHESSLNPGAIGDNGNSFGLFQWNGPRRQELQSFAGARGKDWRDVDTQLDFLDHEVGRDYATLRGRMNAATPDEAARMFVTDFERPADLETNLRARARTALRLSGQSPGILDTISAAARQGIGLISLLGYGGPFHRGLDDPGFNAITTADADPALRPYLSQFIDVRNRDEYDQTAERIRRATEDKETIASAGIFGMVASVAAGILDPINLIPVGGGAWKLLKAGRYVEGALGGIIAGGGGAALQELMLQQADPTRTAEDAGLNIVSGALGGAGLGVGSVAASGSASRLARAGILGTGGAAGGAAAGLGEALYSGQDIGGALATIGTSAVIGGLLGGSVGALARPGRTARDSLHDLARTVDIETDTGNGAIYSDVRRQLLAAGRPEAEADAGGKLWQSHVDAVSRATGVPQADVYRSIGLDVRAGDVPEGALAQGSRKAAPSIADQKGAAETGGPIASITLSAKADASTFLHESGHVFLNTLDRLAEQSPELATDMTTVREWLGNDGGAITRDQHEQWARGFEAYLRDGKAPNSALSEVFARFRDWLTSIYRSLTDLNVELSDDVRGVMDRLIGVDQEPTTGRGGSLSAAAIPAATADDLRIARGAEVPARILARIPIVRGPDIILGTSPVRAARWAMRKLIRPALMTEGDLAGRAEVATENVESAMQQWHGGEVTAKHQANTIYTEYAKAAAKTGEPVLKAQDIIDAASMAGRRGDSGAKLALGPEAQKAAAATAKAYREAVFDPLLKQALEHGLLTKAQVEKARRFADSYIPRVWNINKILEKRTQFTNEVVMPQVVRDWEESRAKLARMRQVTRFADEQLRQIEAAGIEHGGADAAALIAEGADRSPAQIMRENIKQIKEALDDPAAQWADGDEDRARFLLAKSRTPAIAQDGIEGIRKGGPALPDVEAQELQDMLYRTRGLRPADPTDIGVRATRAVQAMRTRVAELERAATTAREAKPLASMTPEQATEAGRMMAEQADKLANDAAAVKALADQYETALKKSLRERAKAYRALDADDAIGRLDEEELPGVASDIVDALVGHTNNRVQYDGLKVTARGALKEKTFNVRDEKVDGGGGGENWLENDIELLASRYTRTLAPDVELKRLTGDVNAEPLRQEIIQEYIDRSNAMEDGPKKRKLDDRLKRDLEAFDGVVSRMRGTYGVPKDAGDVWGLRAARLLKAFNFVRLMGNGPISQIGDVGRIVFRSGMSRFLGDAVMPMISNWDAVKLTKRELQQADIATELVRSSMALRGAEMFDEYSNTTKIEQLANKAAAGASRLYGLDHWNQGSKTIAGMIAQSSLVDGVRKLAAGGDMKPLEMADMSRVGIGAREAEQLKPFLEEFGQDVHGIFIPNTADWAGDGATDAVRLWRGAMRQIADDMVINPGQDRSLFLSQPFKSLLFQLETFNLVSTQRTLLVGLQRRDAGVLIGAGVMVGLGMLSYWLKAKIASWVFGSTSSWKMPDSPGDWILQGVNQSGLLGAFGSLDQRLLAATRGTVGSEALVGSPTRSRFAAADFASLFGPSASAGQVAFTSIQNAAAGDWNWKDTHRLRSLAPMQNYFIVRGLYDQAEKRLNEVMGVRRPVQQR